MTDGTHEDEQRRVEADYPNELIVIFRCGWCGWPCNEDGSCMEISGDEANDYLEKHTGSETVLVNGHCCPNGN